MATVFDHRKPAGAPWWTAPPAFASGASKNTKMKCLLGPLFFCTRQHCRSATARLPHTVTIKLPPPVCATPATELQLPPSQPCTRARVLAVARCWHRGGASAASQRSWCVAQQLRAAARRPFWPPCPGRPGSKCLPPTPIQRPQTQHDQPQGNRWQPGRCQLRAAGRSKRDPVALASADQAGPPVLKVVFGTAFAPSSRG